MSWAFLDDVRDRLRRKVKSAICTDIETRAQVDERMEEVLCMAIKMGDGPVQVLPWEAACARGDWREADRLRIKMFAEIRQRRQLNYYKVLVFLDKSWLARKFLTFVAWARTIASNT